MIWKSASYWRKPDGIYYCSNYWWCLGPSWRRDCSKRGKECGKNFNIADIYHPGDPPIVMPPLNPPAGCEDKMEQRKDDTEEVVKARLQVYKDNSVPVEEFYRKSGMLTDFEIKSGIPRDDAQDPGGNPRHRARHAQVGASMKQLSDLFFQCNKFSN